MELHENEMKHLDEKQKNAILKLIDFKTESEMEKVINRLNLIDAKFESKFEAMDSKINAIYWVIGISITITALISKFV